MRELKFRAWFSEMKQMSSPFTIDELADGGWYDHPQWILRQYTGLKDKNGKEIYEGDVVIHPYNPEETIRISLDPYEVHQRVEYGDWQMLNTTEVIGNIYENPELLQRQE